MLVRAFVPILLLWAGATAFGSEKPPLLISDVDDTVKLADIPHRGAEILNGLYGEKIFAGMPELYTAIARDAGAMVFLSGGPTLLAHHVHDELDDAGFPEYTLILRNIFKKQNSVTVHKLARLEELAAEYPDRPFLLIGDDGESDPEILSTFAASHPGKALAIYIHRVRGRDVPEGLNEFHTAFEIALSELKAGRMDVSTAAAVGEAVLNAKSKYVFPKFVECPEMIEFPTSPEIEASSELQSFILKNRMRWADFCKK